MNGHHHTPAETAELAQARAERLGETIRLAMRIADDHARGDIECECAPVQLGAISWYDTRAIDSECPELQQSIADALHYLDLRTLVIRHPVQRHLVRFPRATATAGTET